MKFVTEIWRPNVDKNGDACISILHEPGEDNYGYEKPEERCLPIHTVETIMISVISVLPDPNGDSPANVDAAKEWREDGNGEFKRKVACCVRKSKRLLLSDIYSTAVISGSPIEKHGTVFPALCLPTYCWTSVVTIWQTLAGNGLQ